MSFDPDLKVQHRAAFACGLLNLGAMIYALAHLNWVMAFAELAWIGCCCVWLGDVRVQQRTRDLLRDHEFKFVFRL
jgi:hypothetical protein